MHNRCLFSYLLLRNNPRSFLARRVSISRLSSSISSHNRLAFDHVINITRLLLCLGAREQRKRSRKFICCNFLEVCFPPFSSVCCLRFFGLYLELGVAFKLVAFCCLINFLVSFSMISDKIMFLWV